MGDKKISVMGIEASFHDVAARRYFGDNTEIVYCNSFNSAMELVANDEAGFCVIAIENSVAGAILPNYKLISQFGLRIDAELFLRIKLQLMAIKGVSIEDITEIHSHQMAIYQSQKFLDQYRNKVVRALNDTAQCAKNVSEGNLKKVAVIAGKESASKYNLKVLFENIETSKNNFTRFLVLSKAGRKFSKPSKATITITAKSVAKILQRLFKILKEFKIEVLGIHSFRNDENRDNGSIYLELQFDSYSKFQKALRKFRDNSIHFSNLGVYHQGKYIN